MKLKATVFFLIFLLIKSDRTQYNYRNHSTGYVEFLQEKNVVGSEKTNVAPQLRKKIICLSRSWDTGNLFGIE